MSNEVDIRINAYQPDNVGCGDEKCCCPDSPLPLSPSTLKDLADAFLSVLDDFGLEGDVRVSQTVGTVADNYPEEEEDEDEEDAIHADGCRCTAANDDGYGADEDDAD